MRRRECLTPCPAFPPARNVCRWGLSRRARRAAAGEKSDPERDLNWRDPLPHEPQKNCKAADGKGWAQFSLRDPESEAAALSELEASFKLKRAWNVDGAANVYFRGKGALAAVGQDLLQLHHFRHRRWARDACRKTCAARDLYAYCLLCLPTDLHPRVMPISRVLGALIATAVDYSLLAPRLFIGKSRAT